MRRETPLFFRFRRARLQAFGALVCLALTARARLGLAAGEIGAQLRCEAILAFFIALAADDGRILFIGFAHMRLHVS